MSVSKHNKNDIASSNTSKLKFLTRFNLLRIKKFQRFIKAVNWHYCIKTDVTKGKRVHSTLLQGGRPHENKAIHSAWNHFRFGIYQYVCLKNKLSVYLFYEKYDRSNFSLLNIKLFLQQIQYLRKETAPSHTAGYAASRGEQRVNEKAGKTQLSRDAYDSIHTFYFTFSTMEIKKK